MLQRRAMELMPSARKATDASTVSEGLAAIQASEEYDFVSEAARRPFDAASMVIETILRKMPVKVNNPEGSWGIRHVRHTLTICISRVGVRVSRLIQ